MTSPAALRREAARLDDLAHRFVAEARQLPNLLDGVTARMGPAVWRGPAADAFTASVRRWQRRLDEEAEALVAVARRLRARAEALRDEARRIEEAEAAAAAARLEAAAARTGAGRVA